jgi:hypothetical protein
MEARIPKLNQTVSAFGQYAAFRVISVDLVSETVDLIANSSTLTLHRVAFTALQYSEAKDQLRARNACTP